MSTPIHDPTAPIICTIGSDEVSGRVELVERMRASLTRIERTDDGLLLSFAKGDAVEADVRRFAVDEKRCCQFWGFAVDDTGDDLTLRWDGPATVANLIDELHAYFSGDEPITAISGLL